jgi:hypothetical protein
MGQNVIEGRYVTWGQHIPFNSMSGRSNGQNPVGPFTEEEELELLRGLGYDI